MKLAWTNLYSNKSATFPFLGAMIFLVMLNLLMQIIVKNDGIEAMPNGSTIRNIFILGNVIIVLFSIIFSFYTNGFLMKSRQRELGLYNVLGMGKKNIRFLLFVENGLNMVIALAIGLILGGAFSKFLFLVLKKLTGFGEEFDFSLTSGMIFVTIAITFGLFILLLFYNMFKLSKINPIDLLHGGQAGEKEPKSHWILSILSFVSLGSGYYLSVTIESPVQNMPLFFLTVLLVIIGTYLLMVSASVTILKFLRKRSSIFYRPKPFVNISGMLYRMKQNGMGLASICILSTMLLVTLSSTAGLFVSSEAGVQERNPVDIKMTSQLPVENLKEYVNDFAEKNNITIDEVFDIKGSTTFPQMELFEGTFTPASQEDYLQSQSERSEEGTTLVDIELIPMNEYQKISGSEQELAADEMLVFVRTGELPYEEVFLGGETFTVKDELDSLPFSAVTEQGGIGVEEYIFIVSDEQTIQQVIDNVNRDNEYRQATFGNQFMLNISGTEEDRLNFSKDLSAQVDVLNEETSSQQINLPNENSNFISISSIDEDRASTFSLNGGFLFLGIVFSLTFAVATALIIYYKQISEGYEDAERFEVMQKVGMSHKEVKQTIRSQILMVFLFPLALAVVHLSFSTFIIKKLLLSLGLNNDLLFTIVTVISVGAFSICYFIVYLQTSKVYYRIVRREN
nr:ABC transporter permease [Mammaliicoccus sp. I-M36]